MGNMGAVLVECTSADKIVKPKCRHICAMDRTFYDGVLGHAERKAARIDCSDPKVPGVPVLQNVETCMSNCWKSYPGQVVIPNGGKPTAFHKAQNNLYPGYLATPNQDPNTASTML